MSEIKNVGKLNKFVFVKLLLKICIFGHKMQPLMYYFMEKNVSFKLQTSLEEENELSKPDCIIKCKVK